MEVIKFLQSFSSPSLDSFFQMVTMLGEESIYIILLCLIFWCIDKKYGYKLAFIFLFSSIVNGIVKNIFKAARPLGINDIRHLRVETATGYSFPSGHTQNITAFFTCMMKRYRTTSLYIGGCTLILLVGISRLYLGLHWTEDVVGGIVFGVLCVFIADYIFDYVHKNNNKYILLVLIPPVVVALFVFSSSGDFVKSSGVFCSFLIGYFIEDRFIKFDTNTDNWKQLIKLVVGLIGVFILKIVLKKIMPETASYEFLRYFIIGIWITIGAPYVFIFSNLTGIELNKKDGYINM